MSFQALFKFAYARFMLPLSCMISTYVTMLDQNAFLLFRQKVFWLANMAGWTNRAEITPRRERASFVAETAFTVAIHNSSCSFDRPARPRQ